MSNDPFYYCDRCRIYGDVVWYPDNNGRGLWRRTCQECYTAEQELYKLDRLVNG